MPRAVTVLPDGTWSVTGSDGFTDTVHPDLTWVRTDAASTLWHRTQQPDGSVELNNYDGSTASLDITGSLTALHMADGSVPVLQEDETWLATLSDGSVSTWDAQGTFVSSVLTVSTGVIRALEADGATRWTMPDGSWGTIRGAAVTSGGGATSASVGADGIVTVTVTGGRWNVLPGDRVERYDDTPFGPGRPAADPQRTLQAVYHLDGALDVFHADGSVTHHSAEGLVSVLTREGTAPPIQGDGSFQATLVDGSVSTWNAQGAFLENRLVRGFETLTYGEAGSRTWSYANGVTQLQAGDGTTLFTVPCGTDSHFTIALGSRHHSHSLGPGRREHRAIRGVGHAGVAVSAELASPGRDPGGWQRDPCLRQRPGDSHLDCRHRAAGNARDPASGRREDHVRCCRGAFDGGRGRQPVYHLHRRGRLLHHPGSLGSARGKRPVRLDLDSRQRPGLSSMTPQFEQGSTPTLEGFSIDGLLGAGGGWSHGWVVDPDLSLGFSRAVPSLQGVYEEVHIGVDGTLGHSFASGVTVRRFVDGTGIIYGCPGALGHDGCTGHHHTARDFRRHHLEPVARWNPSGPRGERCQPREYTRRTGHLHLAG